MQKGQTVYLKAISQLEDSLKDMLKDVSEEIASNATEIRLISNEYPQIMLNKKNIILPYQIVTPKKLNDSLVTLCGGSVHSFQKQLAYGYLTIEGGHRIGFAATASYSANGNINGFRNITSIVIRIARSYEGISKDIISKAFFDGISGLLIAGAPASGKTTILKDLSKQLQYLDICKKIAVIDERGELFNCCGTVLSGYEKSKAMTMALRNLSPQVIICDELGDLSEVELVNQALNSGVNIIATVHASNKRELINRPVTAELIKSGAFKRVVILTDYPTPCTVKEVIECDDLLSEIYRDYPYIDNMYLCRNQQGLYHYRKADFS